MPSKSQLKASVTAPRVHEQSPPAAAAQPKTMTIPEAGWVYFGLSKNGAYDAAARGEIPFMVVGRLKRVSVAKMEQMMLEGVNSAPPPPLIETPAKALARPSKYPRSTAVQRRTPEPVDAN
jgi:hypothetical protein